MKTVIDIPEEYYKAIMEIPINQSTTEMLIIKNGTPLPKGCGRLLILSEDAVKRKQTSFAFSCQSWISDVGLSNATVAIIETDKRDSEE